MKPQTLRRSTARSFALMLVIPMIGSILIAQSLRQAHAHNDYWHERPLEDALSHGFCSVEADVFLSGDELLVGHEPAELRGDRTLRSLYLDPLRSRINQSGGTAVLPGCDFILWIDVKSEPAATWRAIRRQLEDYREILTQFTREGIRTGPITVVVSGNRAASLMLADPTVCAGLDGRVADLALGLNPSSMPWISDDFTRYFSWQGEGEMPQDQRDLLLEIASEAHRSGYRLRFWATPENPAVWRELENAGVDLIGTDDLGALSRHLRKP